MDDSMAKWSAEHVRGIELASASVAPVIGENDIRRVSDDIDIWDAWPVQREDGYPAILTGGKTLWIALGSPRFPDPDERHAHARLHLFQCAESRWDHLGPLLPDGFSPGSREWSGSTVLSADEKTVTLYFTATGIRGETELSFLQRLFRATARLERTIDGFKCTDWTDLTEFIKRDPTWYMATDLAAGGPGTIKAFRDPAYYYDPVSRFHYAFFAGSMAASRSAFNGVIGAAVVRSEGASEWQILPPILNADGVNNELERPHVIRYAGAYYLFWSTQRHVFSPEGPAGPTGLYGMVSDRLDGGWRPLNGTGLVFANPPEAPAQAYSWFVTPDLNVISFVDDWGISEGIKERRFGATFAPGLMLKLDGANAGIHS